MHNNVNVVKQNPFTVFNAFNVPGLLFKIATHFLFNAFCYRFYLSGSIRIADHKEITYRIPNVAKINGSDVITFFLLDGLNDDFNFSRISWLSLRGSFLYF